MKRLMMCSSGHPPIVYLHNDDEDGIKCPLCEQMAINADLRREYEELYEQYRQLKMRKAS